MFTQRAIVLITIWYLLLANCQVLFAGKGTSGWMIFRRLHSPKPKSLVCTTSVRGDLSGVLYNPATLATNEQQELFLFSEIVPEEDKIGGLIYGHPFSAKGNGFRSAATIGLMSYDAGKYRVSYLDAGREKTKTINFQTDVLAIIGYSLWIHQRIPVGITLKFAGSSIAEKATGLATALDLGFLWFLPGDKFSFTLAGQNIGTGKFGSREETLPTSLSTGLAYSLTLTNGGYLSIAAENAYIFTENRHIPSLGLELRYGVASLFFGARLSERENIFNWGGSLYFPKVDVSYAYLPTSLLTTIQRFGLGVRFGEPVPVKAIGWTKNVIEKSKYKIQKIKYWFEIAKRSFLRGKFTDAIHNWEEVLFIDPHHALTKRYIELARAKIRQKYSTLIDKYIHTTQQGEYQTALSVLQQYLIQDPNNPNLRIIKERLEKIVPIFPEYKDRNPVGRLIRIGLNNYLDNEKGNPRICIQSLFYAKQLIQSGKFTVNVPINRLYSIVTFEHPDIVREINGIAGDLIEYKLNQSLILSLNNQYDTAIQHCIETTLLDPENAKTWKQLGTIYAKSGRRHLARDAWKKALDLVPTDAELKELLR